MATRISKHKGTKKEVALEPRKQPVQSRSQESVRAILEAATQVFEQFGYAHGTTNRIAKRAGVSIGTLYQYFPSKEAVAVALLEAHLAEAQRRINDWVADILASNTDLKEAVVRMVDQMIALHGDKPRLQHVLLQETQVPERLHQLLHDVEEQAARTIAGLFRRFPEVEKEAIDDAAYLLAQTVESLTHQFVAHPNGPLSRERFSAELVSMIVAYLKTP